MTVYQWKTGEAPSEIVETVQKVDMETMAQISAGDDGDVEEVCTP